MGTRCLTEVLNTDNQPIVTLYRQFDGYPEGHGKELADFLKDIPIVNGLQGDKKVFNGMECLAASLVAHFKTGPGGFYLYVPGSRDVGEEYLYTITGRPGDAQATLTTSEA